MDVLWPAVPAEGLASLWDLDPAVDYLNHGSFGACPRAVLAHQQTWRQAMERQPVHFFTRTLAPALEAALVDVAAFIGCDADDVAFVSNATSGVNAVLRSLALQPGDQLLTTQHVYNACHNTLNFVAQRTGAHVVVVALPFPCNDAAQMVDVFARAITQRTRLALLDYVTSATGMVLPIAGLVQACRTRGVASLVDAAHAPGMLPLNVRALGATYVTGNFHKWVCAPKSAAFLFVDKQEQASTWPLVISHGYNARLAHKSRFRECFDWPATQDPSALLSVPFALRSMGALLPGGWDAIYAHNHALVVAARAYLCARWGVKILVPDAMLGSLAVIVLPGGEHVAKGQVDPLYTHLLGEGFEVPVAPWPVTGERFLRISAQLYNRADQYKRLGEVVADWLKRPGHGA